MSFLDSLVGNTIQAVEQTATLGSKASGNLQDNLENTLIRGHWRKESEKARGDWLSSLDSEQKKQAAMQQAVASWDPKRGDYRSPANFPEFQKLAQSILKNDNPENVFGPIQTPEVPSAQNTGKTTDKKEAPSFFTGGPRGISVPSALPAPSPTKTPPMVQYQNGKFSVGGEPIPELSSTKFQLKIKTKEVKGRKIPQVSYK